jgi:hypothetical protein
MAERFHPDIEIFSSVSNIWSQPRKRLDPKITPEFPSLAPIV